MERLQAERARAEAEWRQEHAAAVAALQRQLAAAEAEARELDVAREAAEARAAVSSRATADLGELQRKLEGSEAELGLGRVVALYHHFIPDSLT